MIESKEINSVEEMNDWIFDNYSLWRDGLSEDLVKSIKFYSGWGHIDINDANRSGKPIPNSMKTISDNISKGLSMAGIPENVTVYRAVDEAAIVDMALKSGGILESGIIIEDSGFLSTSLTPDTSFMHNYNYIFKLNAIEGVHGAPLQYGDLAVIPEENEVLFDRNSNIYVSRVSKHKRSEIVPNYSGDGEVVLVEGLLTI